MGPDRERWNRASVADESKVMGMRSSRNRRVLGSGRLGALTLSGVSVPAYGVRRLLTLAISLWPCCIVGCATVDYVPEIRQANEALANATGVNSKWVELGAVKELEAQPDGVVTLDHVVERTLYNNRTLRADLAVLGQAKADLVQAGLLTNPVLSIMAGFPESGGRANVAFGLSKDFAELWLIPARKRAAQAVVQQRVLSFTDTAIAVLTDAKTHYFTLQYQSVAIDLQEQNLRVLKEAMEIAEARFRAGDTTQLDVNLVRARYVEAENELLQLRADFRITQRALLRLMGVSRAPDDWHPEPASQDPPPALSTSEAQLVDLALLQRLDAQAARWEMEAAVAEFDQHRRGVISSLNLGLSGERGERRASPDRDIPADTARATIANGALTAPEIQSRSQRDAARRQEIDIILGPSIEVPLPIFDQNQAKIAKARFRARELLERYEETEQRVVESVRAAFTERKLAEDRARLYHDTLVPLQQANLELSQIAYQSGRESILTVLLAQENLIRTRLGFAAASRDLSISAAFWSGSFPGGPGFFEFT